MNQWNYCLFWRKILRGGQFHFYTQKERLSDRKRAYFSNFSFCSVSHLKFRMQLGGKSTFFPQNTEGYKITKKNVGRVSNPADVNPDVKRVLLEQAAKLQQKSIAEKDIFRRFCCVTIFKYQNIVVIEPVRFEVQRHIF
jgi:hypothetical protein